MNSNLYVLNYNNYYNRIAKKLDTLAEYMTYSSGITITNCSFNPNDGVTTTHYFKSSIKQFSGDYLIETQINVAGTEEIKSRWFILEVKRERVGGWTLVLQRDIIADKYDSIINAPMFVEKATVGLNDSAIFNSEDMTFNQIKTQETLLKDKTQIPWVAIYVTQDSTGSPVEITGTVTYNQSADFDLHTMASTDWEYYNVTKYGQLSDYQYGIILNYTDKVGNRSAYIEYVNSGSLAHVAGNYSNNGYILSGRTDAATVKSYIKNTWYGYTGLNNLSTTAFGYLTSSQEEILNGYNGKTIQFSDGLFSINITKELVDVDEDISSDKTDLWNSLSNTTNTNLTLEGVEYTGPYNNGFKLKGKQYQYSVIVTAAPDNANSYTYDFPKTRNHLIDAPYDLILLPFGKIEVDNGTVGIGSGIKDVSYLVAQDIARKYSGSKAVLDIQILPYLPEQGFIKMLGTKPVIDISALNASDYSLIKLGTSNVVNSIALFATKSSFTIRLSETCSSEDDETDNIGYKKRILCDSYRLCSPNYNGIFEFNNIKAGYTTSVMQFDADCTYMPYNPYIHLTPVFKGRLYGQDFDDSRGMTTGGDFSMAMSSSSWETYAINQKNFQASFDRQVQNIETVNAIQKVNDITSAIAGTVQGGVQGGTAGAMAGGPYAAVAGAIVGTTVSAAGGAADVINNEMLRKENLDYTKDQFGYQLGNIKALPESLSKTTAFTYNNKYFPFVEYYTCTDEEKKALENKIKYNGMTVMRIGSINEFLQSDYSYIKGKLIRLEDTGCDSHEVNFIASELDKGVFIK